MALSTTALPEVRAVMSKPSRMGTPLEIKVPSVRVKRATAIFRISGADQRNLQEDGVNRHAPLRSAVPRISTQTQPPAKNSKMMKP